MIVGYYYLHENGELLFKRALDAGQLVDFRESDLVKMFWPLDRDDRTTAWTVLIEAMSLGARRSRVAELAKLWNCNDGDAQQFAVHVGILLDRDGSAWCASRTDCINIQESPCGFGDTCLEAFAELAKSLGYRAHKRGGLSFCDLVTSPLATAAGGVS